MKKLAVLELKGNLNNQGFYVTLHMSQGDLAFSITLDGYLPPSTRLSEHLTQWQQDYRWLSTPTRALKPFKIRVNGTIDPREACVESAQQLEQEFQSWLRSESFREVDLQLRQALMPEDSVQVLIRTASSEVQALPWHLWDFIEQYPKAEVALSGLRSYPCASEPNLAASDPNQVNILAVLGDSTHIDVERDKQILNALPGAKVKFLLEPTHQKLNETLYEKSWDILFFAGHSNTEPEGQGVLRLNPTTHLTIDEVRYAVRRAIAKGLQLAIFNSCDGLGLARALAELQLPQIIVMREVVPDVVAQQFLKYFLEEFSQGQSLHLAQREARQRLHGMEKEYPCASWLPVIYQHLGARSMTWQDLMPSASIPTPVNPIEPTHPEIPTQPVIEPSSIPCLQYSLQIVGLTSILFTLLVTGVRWLGILQTWELKSYDQLLRQRPQETADPRLLIVEANEQDIRQYGHPLPDWVLARVIQTLNQHEPLAIGLDIYRDRPVPPGQDELKSQFQQNQRLITACTFGDQKTEAIAPPPTSPKETIGFVDLEKDTTDYGDSVRRLLLSRYPVESASPCMTPYSFSLQLLFSYLDHSNTSIQDTITPDLDWQFGDTVLKRLTRHSGGYQQLDARGNQILINYRATDKIAQRVTVNDLLSDKVNQAWIKNKIILMGVTAPSIQDNHYTPYGQMRGLDIHAHSISQLLSTIFDKRPLIHGLSLWGDILWTLGWSIIGGLLIGVSRHYFSNQLLSLVFIGIFSGSIGLLYLICWLAIIEGLWLSFIPTMLVLIATEGFLSWVPLTKNKQKPNQKRTMVDSKFLG